ncbi:MAG: ferredoxin [Pseudomonadota bacterium]
MGLPDLERAVSAVGLSVIGGFHPKPGEGPTPETRTLYLLGPTPGAFWPVFVSSAEATDNRADPMDRWSSRVLDALADELGAVPAYPFDGPPHHPFYSWALRTGRVHASPVQLLVDGRTGLWVAFRGALAFDTVLDVPPPEPIPCASCAGQPCLSACPVTALTTEGYDVPRCKDYLTGVGSRTCMTGGCAVRAACPASQVSDRHPAQSAFHMEAFLGR